MRIRWTPAAAGLQHISDYLKDHHPHYRQPTMRKLYEAIRSLKTSPHRGRPGREEGTREILFPPLPYVAVTHVKGT
jgi:plasmid stabilization system protein ParE